jgi:hypothetical protein
MSPLDKELWGFNTPVNFWLCQEDLPDSIWQEAYARSSHLLELTINKQDIDSILALTLGEGRFSSEHWELGPLKRAYYLVKSLIPRPLRRQLRQIYNRGITTNKVWPIEHRYVDFLWEVMRQVLDLSGLQSLSIKYFWPDHNRYAFILTHDIETAAGQDFVEVVADLEESLGFYSSFNFVPEKYHLNYELMDNLRRRGFEVGVHGLKHNGRLFDSKSTFIKNASRINRYLKEWNATGFRAELTHRQPEWMQALEIGYDLSFFDTDPFEPIPGGTMSIWPFFIGHFVELPYTLVQDYTLTSVLGENSPRIWLKKIDFIEKHHGMALVNTHPDYLKSKPTWKVYYEFLNDMKKRDCYWHALPDDVARWWKARILSSSEISIPDVHLSTVLLDGDSIKIEV